MELLWKDRKRTFLGLPWSFTKYSLSEDRIFIDTGFFKTVSNEVRLYRVLDLQLVQTFGQKLLGLGTIKVNSSDKSMHNFEIKNIKKSKMVKELLSESVEKQRDLKRVVNREVMGAGDDYDDEFHDDVPDDASDDGDM